MNTPTRRRGQALEHAIRQAALDELAERGYAQLTMESVARRARTGKGALYRRWAAKQELVLDALLGAMPDLPEVEATGSVRQQLLMALTAIADTLAGRGSFPGLDVLAEVLRIPELRDAFGRQVIAPRVRVVMGILQRAAERGEIDASRVDELVARTGPALVVETYLLTGAPPAPNELSRILETVVIPLLAPT